MLLIREATPADAALLVDMIRELADFEKELDQVEVTPEDMVREGFTGSPGFHALIAEWDARPVGYAVYFFTFSTWTGRQSLFVEDLFVREEFRRKGIGRAMLRHLAAIAQERNCYGMSSIAHSGQRCRPSGSRCCCTEKRLRSLRQGSDFY